MIFKDILTQIIFYIQIERIFTRSVFGKKLRGGIIKINSLFVSAIIKK